ncbi:MAG TPA: DUF4282 domain-containing protein [Candidatus Limnocylindrales bacterium]|nr:DUF4282 domain-containing protein [Candidatus Limnocylindrales bacterium]
MATSPTPPSEPPVSWTTPPPPGQPGNRGFDVSDFIAFRYLITPGFITAIYVVGAVLITLAALAAMAGTGSGGLVGGLVVLFFGNLWWRIVLEFVMVLFRINDSLASIDRRGGGM